MNTPINSKIQRIKAIAAELREMFPGMSCVSLDAQTYSEVPTEEIRLHGVKTYAQSTNIFRSLGIGCRHKTPYIASNSIGAYTQVTGTIDRVTLSAYPDELPPSCHIEKVVERIPKQQTVDTGEFIEVERQKVVCGHELEVA
jgi:hypothetical protein